MVLARLTAIGEAIRRVADSRGPAPMDFEAPLERRGRLRLRTLVLLRWLAVAGQSTAILVVALVLRFDLPLGPCLGVIAASAWLNVFLSFAGPGRRLAKDWEAAAQLGFDVVQLTVLLALTGGLENPFALMLIAPVTVAAATLPTRWGLAVALLGFAATTALAVWSLPLPWFPDESVALPVVYRAGVWTAVVVGMAFTAGYAWQAALEASRMELALAATQAVLAREQRLSALGGLAAAAAHELGTPLSTIQVVAKEMARAAPEGDPVGDDARLLLQQAQRCREILATLAQRPETDDPEHNRLGLLQLLEEAAQPFRGDGPEITTRIEGPEGAQPPEIRRIPELVHALSSFVENAADFAASGVEITARYDADEIRVEVSDDGPGFAPDVIVRLGEPYVTSRPEGEGSPSGHEGMGLGFFIAKTLMERSGATVTFGNARKGGATVQARWRRSRLEAAPRDSASGLEAESA